MLKIYSLDFFYAIGPDYFLNLVFQYSGTCEFNTSEVRRGLKEVIKRLEPNLEVQAKAMNEVHKVAIVYLLALLYKFKKIINILTL